MRRHIYDAFSFFRKIPLIRVIPIKFTQHLRQKNSTLIIQLQSIQSRDEQLTLVAGIQWGEFEFDEKFYQKEMQMSSNEDVENTNTNTDNLQEPLRYCKPFKFRPSNIDNLAEEELAERRMELWAEDRLFNELMEKFDWDFEWLAEQIPVDSPHVSTDWSWKVYLAIADSSIDSEIPWCSLYGLLL